MGNFDLFCKIILESTKKNNDYLKALNQFELTYGPKSREVVSELLNVVEEHSKRLLDFRDSPQGKRPSKPSESKLNEALAKAKTDSDRERIQKKYDLRMQDYNKTTKYINDSIKRLYQDKLDDLFKVYQKISKFDVPIDKCQLEYVLGNSKVGEDTIIINMGPATICDAAKDGQCDLYLSGNCYAQNNETQYKKSIIKRIREKLQWKSSNASVISTQIADVITTLRKKGSNINFVRFNESGDFSSVEDKTKLGQIVNETNALLKKGGEKKVIFYTYTHRSDLFKNGINDIKAQDLIIQGSGSYGKTDKPFFVDNCFMAINYNDTNLIVENGLLKNTPELRKLLNIDSTVELPKVVFCRGECFKCNYCKTKDKKLILIAYHGKGTEITLKSSAITRQIGDMFKTGLKKTIDAKNLPLDLKKDLLSTQYYNENNIIDKLIPLTMYRRRKGSTPAGVPMIDPNTLYDLLISIRQMIDNEILKNPKSDINKVFTRFKNTKTGKYLNEEELKIYFNDLVKKIEKYNEKFLQKTDVKPEIVNDDGFNEDDESLNESVGKPSKIDLSNTTPQMFANLSVAGLLKNIKGFIPESQINSQNSTTSTEDLEKDVTVEENVFYRLAKDLL